MIRSLRPLIAATAIAASIFISGCSTLYPSTSGFGDVQPGVTKADVIRKHGNPLLENVTTRDGKEYTVLTYLESVLISGDWRHINVELYFLDSRLTDKVERLEPPKPPTPPAPAAPAR